jgi:hypothetical protein
MRYAEDLRRYPSLPSFNARSRQSTRAGRGRMVDEKYKPRLLACGWDPIKEVTSSTTSGFGDGTQSTVLCVSKAVPFRLRHHDGSTTLYFSYVAIAQTEVGLLAGKCDMAAFLTDIHM